ncbi:MAG: bifunctional DNA-formamidopyrimidine glycosylase/DNA-(apurinic or apyrimidinic site) lyase [bacterium]
MPELPEVETVVRELNAHGLVGRTVTGVGVVWPRVLVGDTVSSFTRKLRGRRIEAVGRRAKYILLTLADGMHLAIHLRMTGQLHFAPQAAPRDQHETIWLVLDDGVELRFHDTRKFGVWKAAESLNALLPALGPEPLDPAFTAVAFAARLRGQRRQIKPLLLDQAFLAGVGNIYADEALWEARLHPQRRAGGLSRAQAAALYAAVRRVLAAGIANHGTSLGDGATNFARLAGYRGGNALTLKVFRRDGQPCPRCGATLRRIVVGQRGTHFCASCQRSKTP